MISSILLGALLAASGPQALDAKHLLFVEPGQLHLNSEWTVQSGATAGWTYAAREGFGLRVQGTWNWTAHPTDYTRELNLKVRESPRASALDLLLWNVVAGFEAAPLRGELNGRTFSIILFAGAGLGGTGLFPERLKAEPSIGSAFDAMDTGLRVVGSSAVSFRMNVTDLLGFQVGLRHAFFSSQLTHVNGCSEHDLEVMGNARRAGDSLLTLKGIVDGDCRLEAFHDTRDVFQAHDSVRSGVRPGSALVVLRHLTAGFVARF